MKARWDPVSTVHLNNDDEDDENDDDNDDVDVDNETGTAHRTQRMDGRQEGQVGPGEYFSS